MTKDKVVAIYCGSFVFVGHASYVNISNSTDHETLVVDSVIDVYQMIISPIPRQDAQGNVGVVTNISGFRIGSIQDIPENAVIAELDSRSLLYEGYVAVSSGIKKASII